MRLNQTKQFQVVILTISLVIGSAFIQAQNTTSVKQNSTPFEVNPIELDSAALHCLGILKKRGSYTIGFIDGIGYLSSRNLFTNFGHSILATTNHHGTVTDSKLDSWGFKALKLTGISSSADKRPQPNATGGFYGSRLDSCLNSHLINASIPIAIELSSNSPGRMPHRAKAIVWIVPDDGLFNCLPDCIGPSIKNEFEVNFEHLILGHEAKMDSVRLLYPIRSKKIED